MAHEGTNRALQSEIENLPHPDQEAVNTVWGLFSASNSNRRRLILTGILTMCCPSQLSFLTDSIRVACRTDPFIRLPKEISLTILSYLDAFSLGKAAQVSRLWRKLADDDMLWKSMCQQHIERTCLECGWGLPSMEKTKYGSCSTKRQHQQHLLRKRVKLDRHHTPPSSSLSLTSQPAPTTSSSPSDPAPPVVPSSPQSPSDQDLRKPWKAVYTERLALERHWRKGNYVERVLTGHTDSITCSQIETITNLSSSAITSTSSLILMTGSWDKSIKVWNLDKFELIQTLIGHTLAVRCLQFDNYKVISGGNDRMIKVWNWRTGQCIRTIEGHADSVTCLNFDDELLVSGSSDTTIKIWDFSTGSGYILRGHTDQVNSLKLNSSAILFSCSDDHQIRIWNLKRRETIQILSSHVNQVQSLSLISNYLISGSLDNTIKVWNFNLTSSVDQSHKDDDDDDELDDHQKKNSNVKCERTLFGHIQGVWSVDADQLRIVSGSHDRSLKIWDRLTGKCVHTLVGHRGAVTTVLLTDDKVISGGDDGEIRIWSFGSSSLTTSTISTTTTTTTTNLAEA